MIYVTKSGLRTIVGAADTAAELEGVHTDALAADPKLYAETRLPDRSEMMMEDAFRGFRQTPRIYEHESAEQQAAFIAAFGLTVVPHDYATDKQETMLRESGNDPFWNPEVDDRTIGEILGLDKHDPWDKRSDEQKAKDEHYKKMADQAKKAGQLSGESFGKKGDLHVTDIGVKQNDDGSIAVSGVEAVKGFDPSRKANDERVAAAAAQAALLAEAESRAQREFFYVSMKGEDASAAKVEEWATALGLITDPIHEAHLGPMLLFSDFHNDHAGVGTFRVEDERTVQKLLGMLDFLGIDFGVMVGERSGELDGDETINTRDFERDEAMANTVTITGGANVYHRVDFAGASIVDVREALIDSDILPHIVLVAAGQTREGAWIAARSKAKAEELAKVVEAGLTWDAPAGADKVEVYGVNSAGQRLVPKGSVVVEEAPKEEPLRPWNHRAAEFAALSEEEQKALLAKMTGDEFLFCTSYVNATRGCTVWIVPAAYFRATGEMWETPIAEVITGLPADFKQVSPNVFNTKSRDDKSVMNLLSTKGMRENLKFQMFINLLD